MYMIRFQQCCFQKSQLHKNSRVLSSPSATASFPIFLKLEKTIYLTYNITTPQKKIIKQIKI